MWDKLIIALVVAGVAGWLGYREGIEAGQRQLHDCQQARAKDQAAQERRTAQRAISNAETIARLRNERDAKEVETRAISRRAAERQARDARELRERDRALVAALQDGHDCVVDPDAIRLLDEAATGARLPSATGAGSAAGTPAGSATRSAPPR